MIKDKHLNSQQLGATLIEIMIAMLIGLFLLGGLIQIFSGSKQTYRLQDNMSRLQENGRFAMDFISRDVRMADYWGCIKDGPTGSNFTNYINPPPGAILGVSGTDDDNGGNNGDNDNDENGNSIWDGTDSITLRRADNAIPITANQATASAALTIAAGSDLAQNNVVLVADCSQADLFQITNDPSSGTIEHALQNPGNTSASLTKRYRTDASIYSSTTDTYDIQPGASLRPDGSSLPALFKNGQELVEGIENMQIVYGVDLDTDTTAPGFGTPDFYVTADLVPDMNQVVSIRINLLAITPDDNVASAPVDYTYDGVSNITPTDSSLRREFSSTIAIRNRLR